MLSSTITKNNNEKTNHNENHTGLPVCMSVCLSVCVSVLARNAASCKRPLFSDSNVHWQWCCRLANKMESVRSTACVIQTTSTLLCKACSVASHVAYRLVCLSVSVTSTRHLWAVTHRIAQPGELCAMQQSPNSKFVSRSSGTQKSSPEGGSTSQQPRAWPCDNCSRVCSSRIGLHAHQQTHRWQAIRRSDGAVHACRLTCIYARNCYSLPSVCLSVCLSVCMYVCLSLCLLLCISLKKLGTHFWWNLLLRLVGREPGTKVLLLIWILLCILVVHPVVMFPSVCMYFCSVSLYVSLSLWLVGTVRAEPETVISRAWVQSPDPAE